MKATGRYIISSYYKGLRGITEDTSLVFGFQEGEIFHLKLTEMNFVFLRKSSPFYFCVRLRQ